MNSIIPKPTSGHLDRPFCFFRCPEVGLGFSLLGVHWLDEDASRLRRAEVGSRGDRQDERMSRRSSRYKGGVTRGREEQPQGNSTMKRGSPTTKMSVLE